MKLIIVAPLDLVMHDRLTKASNRLLEQVLILGRMDTTNFTLERHVQHMDEQIQALTALRNYAKLYIGKKLI